MAKVLLDPSRELSGCVLAGAFCHKLLTKMVRVQSQGCLGDVL